MMSGSQATMGGAARPRRPARAIWRDPRGRFSALKAVVLGLLPLPGLVVAITWMTVGLGARPITEALHQTGFWTIRLLFASLAITPLCALLAWPKLLQTRRMIGVACALYAGVHITLYADQQGWNLVHVGSEIIHRFYLTIGFAALLGLATLAITSTDGWVRHLRGNWVRLHKLIHPIAALALLHFFLQSKADVSEPALMSGLLVWLWVWRALPRSWRGRLVVVWALVPLAFLASAWFEAGWYWMRNGVDPWMIFTTNFNPLYGIRPAVWTALVALGLAIAASARVAGGARLRG